MTITTETARPTARATLRSDVLLAGRVLPVHHPLHSFIAVNPLAGLEARPFADALRCSGEWYGARGTLPEAVIRAAYRAGRITDADLTAALTHRRPGLRAEPVVRLGEAALTAADLLRLELLAAPPAPRPRRRHRTRSERTAPAVARQVDAYTTRWCAAFLGDPAAWPMPGRGGRFYAAWRDLAFRDATLPRPARAALRRLPEQAEDALGAALDRLGVGAADRVAYLRADLTRMPGWAAHVRWHAERGGRMDLVEYLAMRLTYESLLLPPSPGAEDPAPDEPAAVPPAQRRAATVAAALGAAATAEQLAAAAGVLARYPAPPADLVWLEAYEHHYRTRLLRRLPDRPGPASRRRPAAQVVCCIDVRSEGLRRHLEAQGDYETYGFAGFFAMPISFRGLDGAVQPALCPALISPAHLISERPAAGGGEAGVQVVAAADTAWHAAKDGHLSPFALAELSGWVAGPLAAARTALPVTTARLRQRLRGAVTPPVPGRLDANESVPLEERLLYAQALLSTIGLSCRMARVVVLCAHGSTTENNPFQAALDCGACGGHRGGPNARTAAAVLNDAEVRTGLAARGVVIPADTWFVAAEHDTTTDRVLLLDAHLIPEHHRGDVQRLARDLARAGAALAAERGAALPGTGGRKGRRLIRRVRARADDWAQVYPEWGLAGNAAFIVGPRSLTVGLDLERRVFLHSYDAEADLDGTALETILTAPLVVAQWINAQYYFSSVEPDVFGAGTKPIHNAVGAIGVLSGHDGDLRLGLPWQSVGYGDDLVHEPMRLLAVVQAPLDRIAGIVERNPVLRRLIHGEWIALTARERPGEAWQRYGRDGWRPWTGTDPREQEHT
ncbi:DUF2309 domain-containing protein [Dactylosporangium matsuzakiense]|uniref:Probable inorganic carbon transporter subunit DabA n=1 Tax=Dactylosporangium matsuzakiense TaxID=53360 RepID=A0A9W6KW54_9ACTN|nr:DUF2309 domain-containing protein [Dactylosporangium matsuzakiense]UWZ41351.1 DUF2309 domain-containing protein [Dactylosporangium matsuzakiense]GLL08280.1 UPF0753 protein [Dactylosporangium matsuzakiense]